jgi:hypothetical protein
MSTMHPPAAAADPNLSLKLAMRRLWTDHVLWTRDYIVTALRPPHGVTGLAEHLPVGKLGSAVATTAQAALRAAPMGLADATAGRLLKNQDDIGNAVVPYYGHAAGRKLAALLKQHIMIAVELLQAADTGNQSKFERKDRDWSRNAEKIAELLSAANPENWSKSDLVDLLQQHLKLTKQEVEARIGSKWDDDVAAFDLIHTEILTLADVLSDGIAKQRAEVPPVNVQPTSQSAASLKLALRRLWADHVIWTREYVVAASVGKPDADAAAQRLMKNQEDIGNAVVPVYGGPAGQRLTELLKQHIAIAVELIAAAKAGDKAVFQQKDREWSQNAEAIADLLSSANPENWPKRDVVDLLEQHLRLTKQEVTARLERHYSEEVKSFDLILTEILTLADVLADGIVRQHSDRFVA